MFLIGGLLVLQVPFALVCNTFFLSDDLQMVRFGATFPLGEIGWLPSSKWAWHRPLPALGWILNYRATGFSPIGFHLPNVLIHAGNTALAYGLWRRLGWERSPSAWAAALFAWSPVTAGTVMWVSARPDLLAVFFMLAALIVSASHRVSMLRLGAVALLAILAVSSKESAFALAPVVVALAFFGVGLGPAPPSLNRVQPAAAAIVVAVLGCFLSARWWLYGSTLGGYGVPLRAARAVASPLRGILSSAFPVVFDRLGVAGLLFSATALVVTLWFAPGLALSSAVAALPAAHLVSSSLPFWEYDRFYYFVAVWTTGSIVALLGTCRRRGVLSSTTVTVVLCLVLAANLGYLLTRAAGFRRAGALAARVDATLRSHVGRLPAGTVILCDALPDHLEGAYVYRNGCSEHVALIWPDGSVTGGRMASGGRPGGTAVFALSPDGLTLKRAGVH